MHAFLLVAILRMSNFLLLAAESTIEVGDLTTTNTMEKVLPTLWKTVWRDDKIRKHTDDGGWEYLWCGFHKVTDNHTKHLSHVAKVNLLGVNVSLCLAKIPYFWLEIYNALLNKNRGKNSAKKRAQEQVIQDINGLQETGSKVLFVKNYRKSSSSPQRSPPAPS